MIIWSQAWCTSNSDGGQTWRLCTECPSSFLHSRGKIIVIITIISVIIMIINVIINVIMMMTRMSFLGQRRCQNTCSSWTKMTRLTISISNGRWAAGSYHGDDDKDNDEIKDDDSFNGSQYQYLLCYFNVIIVIVWNIILCVQQLKSSQKDAFHFHVFSIKKMNAFWFDGNDAVVDVDVDDDDDEDDNDDEDYYTGDRPQCWCWWPVSYTHLTLPTNREV